uniref:Glycoprotein n=1 Tax=Coleopteran chu-related virus OKIAV151 TaxID=2746340 RepID=A0A7D7F3A0_9VIRU|nr:glycoprotein [Coleopteran chu-related virus OKIAV151]
MGVTPLLSLLILMIELSRSDPGLGQLYPTSATAGLDMDNSIIGYDCNPNSLNYTRINLESVQDCDIKRKVVRSATEAIQLVQRVDEITVNAFICRVRITRHVMHCGAHGYTSMVTGGLVTYVYDLGRERCLKAISTGELCLFCYNGSDKPLRLSGLQKKTTRRQPHNFAGWTDEYGWCGGAYYSDPIGSWHGVVVQGFVEIFLDETQVKASTTTNDIHLPSGLRCDLSKEGCTDDDIGEIYWKALSEDTCKPNGHLVLYEGMANVTYTDTKSDFTKSIISVYTDDTLFSLRILKPYSICGLEAFTTEHPKLVIIRKSSTGFWLTRSKQQTSNYDLFTYMNSKFVFVERNMQLNLEELYFQLQQQSCSLDKSQLNLLLALAYTDPLEFAYIKGGGPGYTATRVGEIMYLTKCTPVVVQYRKTEKCYHELPILFRNQTGFLSPKSRLIQKHGQEVTCNSIFPPVYRLLGRWYRVHKGDISEVTSPETLKPQSGLTWNYYSPSALARSGIYSQDELDRLKEHIMNGPEREAIASILTRGYTGSNPDHQGGSLANLLDENEVEKFGERIWSRIWGSFMSFGAAMSGLVGLFMTLRILKWIIDTIIHGRALYELYGFSVALVGAIWDSLTMFLIHRRTPKTPRAPGPNACADGQESVPLQSISITDQSEDVQVMKPQPTCPDIPTSHPQIYPSLTSSFSNTPN